MSEVLNGLNPAQSKAVQHIDGPLLIVAGAGSGKTRVLTSRVAYLIENGVPPERILSLTFTKKAATEMKDRIADMVGARKARRIYMGTFHSVFIRFLREFSSLIGFPSDFTIYDQGDSVSAVKTVVKQLGLDDKIYKPREVQSRISNAKNNLITPTPYSNNAGGLLEEDKRRKKPEICRIYKTYAEACRRSGVMDFDDILLWMNILLRDHPEAVSSISGRFSHILVDEYQDTNYAQYVILLRLCQSHHNICVVGDDSQSIYAFRGARIENILNFRKDFPESEIVRLEQNYRSTRTIVEAANSLIARNVGRIPKTCVSVGEEGEKIVLVRAYTESEEAVLVVSGIISRMRTDHAEYSDFAVLYRTNAQSRALEEQLRKRNIPYIIYSGNSFFERAEVKDMMAYLKLAVNPSDDESFRRIVNTPARGIGGTSMAALSAAAAAKGMPLMKAAYETDLESFGLKAAAIQKIRAFADMITKAHEAVPDTDAHAVARMLAMDSGLYSFHKTDNSIEGQSRAANIEELLSSVAIFRDERHTDYITGLLEEGTIQEPSEVAAADLPKVLLPDFLEDISLLSAVDVKDDGNSNKVALMTVHSAKGLEFPYVFITGLEENLFPSGGYLASETDIEEERRLFYVAVTRAEKAVTLCYSEGRMRNGSYEQNPPSRFLREIDPKYIANPLRREESPVRNDRTPSFRSLSGPSAPRPSTPSGLPTKADVLRRERPPEIDPGNFIPDAPSTFNAGDRIEHNRFGKGTVTELSGEGLDRRAKVSFDSYGEKILILKFAKMRHI